MSVLIDATAALHMDFSQAFVYPDACFMLSFLDSDDHRGDDVAKLIDMWKDRNVTIGLSTHVYQEVVGVLFKNTILRSLEIQSSLELGKKRMPALTSLDHKGLVNPESARFLYKVGRQVKMIDDRGKFKGSVFDLLKYAKERELEKSLLQPYYSTASQEYTDFITLLTANFNVFTEVLETNGTILDTANSFTHLLQLDSTDAVHYAIAVENDYNYLVTLDGDFSNATYDNIPNLKTNVIKVA
jgi:predicted nucleic acid-binding protein